MALPRLFLYNLTVFLLQEGDEDTERNAAERNREMGNSCESLPLLMEQEESQRQVYRKKLKRAARRPKRESWKETR